MPECERPDQTPPYKLRCVVGPISFEESGIGRMKGIKHGRCLTRDPVGWLGDQGLLGLYADETRERLGYRLPGHSYSGFGGASIQAAIVNPRSTRLTLDASKRNRVYITYVEIRS